MEDFGFWGDEYLMGDCQQDWLDMRADEYDEQQQALKELYAEEELARAERQAELDAERGLDERFETDYDYYHAQYDEW